jgi:hypothetical protein
LPQALPEDWPEASIQFSGNARGEVYAIINPGPGPTAIDTVVTHPCSATSIATGFSDTPGTATAAAGKRKHCAFAPAAYLGRSFEHLPLRYGFVGWILCVLLLALLLALA